jgi:hypothetical protein
MEDLKCTNCGNQMSAAPKAPQQVSNTPQDAIGYVMENYAEFYAKHGQTVMTPEPESGRIPVYATPPQQQEQSGEVFDADDPKFREAFDAALASHNYPATRKGDLYRSSVVNMAWFIAYSVVNRLRLYTSPTTPNGGVK